MDSTNEIFSYTYSATEQEEVKKIREKYLPKEMDKLEELRRLDASVTNKATVVSLIIGIISCLVLGSGMSMCMVWNFFIPGILIGIIGIAGVAAAYPLYVKVISTEREKIAPQIIQLTEELMK